MRFVILTFLFFPFLSLAQNEEEELEVQEDPISDFSWQQEPEFPGGEAAMMTFVANNIVYPDTAKTLGLDGRVFVQFVIDTVGNVTDVNVVRGVHWSLDDEAMRVVKLMPRWVPGRENGKAVRVRYTLPITFRLT